METVFRWIHISDIHMGRSSAASSWDQALVLRQLELDIARRRASQPGGADAIFVTGDIGNTGAGRSADEYRQAETWLQAIARSCDVANDRIFLVPGNHDVDRGVDSDLIVRQLVANLRDGKANIDDALADSGARALLARRMQNYLEFARPFGPPNANDGLLWTTKIQATSGLPVRIIGLNTALLAAADDDHGKLRLGLSQIGPAILEAADDEFVIALAHHPLQGGWLFDERTVVPHLTQHAHLLLTGHVHEAAAEQLRIGAGSELLRVVAGAAHGDGEPGAAPAGHGYNFGSLLRGHDGKVHVHVVPRRWSAKRACFTPDVDNIPDDQSFSEHTLAFEVFAKKATPPAPSFAPSAFKVSTTAPVRVFVSSSNAPRDQELRTALHQHLSTLQRSGRAAFKYSQQVPSGEDRPAWIQAGIDEAHIILLLISRDYVGSDEYFEDEIQRAVRRHQGGEARVIPILIRNFAISDEPFAVLQPLPRGQSPVDRHPDGEDAALAEISREIAGVVSAILGG